MSFEVNTAFVQQYNANMAMLAQQRKSRFRRAVMTQDVTGKRFSYDQVGQSEAEKVTVRHAKTPFTPLPHRRRWIAMDTYRWSDLIDNPDAVRMLAEPSSAYAQAGIAAMNRTQDAIIAASFFADASTGEDGATTVSFPAANVVAVNSWAYGAGSGNASLTISKLIEARSLLLGYEAGEDNDEQSLVDAYIAVTKKEWASLLATTEATSRDFAGDMDALRTGKIRSFMGFEFIRYEGLPTDGSGYRRIPVWQKQGMMLGIGQDPVGRITERDDLSYATQVFYEQTHGAARVEENRVIEIKCL